MAWDEGDEFDLVPVDYDPFDAAAARLRRPYGAQVAGPQSHDSDVLDTVQSMPRGALLGLSKAISAGGQGAQVEMGQPVDVPEPEIGRDLLEQHVTGPLHQPHTRAGRYGETVGEMIGNPVNYLGPGSLAAKTGWNVASGLASEAGGQLYEGRPEEPLARTLASWGPAAAERAILGGAYKLIPQGSAGSLMGKLGQPDSLYHGSPNTDLQSLSESTRGPLGPGVYTSPAEGIAKSYAGERGKIYELPPKDRDIYRGHGHRTDEEWFGFKEDKTRLLAAAEPEKRAELSKILDRMWSGDGYPTYQRIMHLYGGDEGAQALFKKAGFHGVSGLVDGPEVLLFGEQALKPEGTAYHTEPVDHDPFDTAKLQKKAAGGPVEEPKATKAKAHYRIGNKAKRCGICTMFRAPHSCTSVEGTIRPGGLCDYFEAKAEEGSSTGAVVRTFDVPFLAGSSNDNKTVFIDRRVPRTIRVKRANGKGYRMIDPAEPLSIHERSEHRAMNAGKSYEKAHAENGTADERAWVKGKGLDWDHYEEVLDGLLSHIEHEHPKKPPPTLYDKPYPHSKQLLLEKLEKKESR